MLSSGVILQWALSQHTLSNTAAPGRLIDVGGHRLHLHCEGAGGPSVILEPGLPGSSVGWESVTADISRFARVCTYDRAGYAWSETSPSPRTAANIVRELRLLLQTAGIDPPYVLVGHSFGGLVMQLYAGQFPSEVAGMVLVDSSHPDQVSRTVDLDSASTIGLVVGILAPTPIPRFFLPLPEGSPESRDNSVRKMERELMMTTRSLRTTAAELAGLRESLKEAAANPPNLGHRPLIVLTEGRKPEFWHEMQEDLTNLSEVSDWQIVEDAGHFIHHDRPEVVVDAIRRVLDQVRSGAS